MQPRGILETALYGSDLEAAERFYHGVLGLEVFQRETDRHVFFRLEREMLLFFNPQSTANPLPTPWGVVIPSHGGHGPGHVAFRIHAEELPEWRRRLTQSHVAIETEIVWPNGGLSLYFRDPAGNSVELATPKLWDFPEEAVQKD